MSNVNPVPSSVRVRFAPSPTGSFHIGSARTALFNWLYARHTGGTFILRIEDTDKERNTPHALEVLLQGLKWLGLNWDEGPGVGGDKGPYFQSQRDSIYLKYLEQLKSGGHVYEKEGALWFRVSDQVQVIEDAVRGRVERKEEKDFVIYRSNGTPVFHFVNVVDDIAMGITHIIRGEDHLSNTSKHIELFKAFKAPIPVFAHIPLILKSNGSGKMSKRDEGALIEDYARKQFLPDAVRNYLCLLGWSPKDDREILPIEVIIDLFDLSGINKNNARFDEKKMAFFNTEHVRMLPLESLTWLARPILGQAGVIKDDEDENHLQAVLNICHEKIRALEELPPFVRYFFHEDYALDLQTWSKIGSKGDPYKRVLEFREWMPQQAVLNAKAFEEGVYALAQNHHCKSSDYMKPVRFAVSGMDMGPSFYLMLEVLGESSILRRLDRFLKEMKI